MLFPCRLDEQDLQQHQREYARLKVYGCRMEKELGDGWLSNERYEEVRGKCDELQRHLVNCNGGGLFPFQNGGSSVLSAVRSSMRYKGN